MLPELAPVAGQEHHQPVFIPSSPLQPINFAQDTACTTILGSPKLGKLPISSSSAKWVDHTSASQDARQGGASSVSFTILPPELSTEWASPVAQMVYKNPLAIQETPVRFLCLEDPLENYPLQYS